MEKNLIDVFEVLCGWQRVLLGARHGVMMSVSVCNNSLRVVASTLDGRMFRRSLFRTRATRAECDKFLTRVHVFLDLNLDGVELPISARVRDVHEYGEVRNARKCP